MDSSWILIGIAAIVAFALTRSKTIKLEGRNGGPPVYVQDGGIMGGYSMRVDTDELVQSEAFKKQLKELNKIDWLRPEGFDI